MIKYLAKKFFGRQEKTSGTAVIHDILKYIDEHDLYPDLRVFSSAIEPVSIIDGKEMLMFASNNYLGLANHPKVKQAAVDAINKYGVGATGARVVTGNIDVNIEVEHALAKFKGGEAAIVYPTGFAANLGTISAVMNPLKVNVSAFLGRKGVILSDELNHASIVDGIRISGQEKHIFKHNDLDHLELLLKKFKNRRKLIVVDAVFSMDGDIAPLDKISVLAKKYNAMTMIDEAHSVGVLGKNGGGAMEHFNLKTPEDITIVMGTLSKAIGCMGGYVVGSKELVKYLKVAGRSYLFSTGIAPAISSAVIASLDVIKKDHERRTRLWDNISYFKRGFNDMGLKMPNGESAIIPVLIGGDEMAIKISRELYKRNIYAPNVRWPVVPRGESRIRFTITSEHTKEQIDVLHSIFKDVATLCGLIK